MRIARRVALRSKVIESSEEQRKLGISKRAKRAWRLADAESRELRTAKRREKKRELEN